MIAITLRRIMECEPCYDPIERGIFPEAWDLDAPISFQWLAEKIPPEDVIWCFSNLPDEHDCLKRYFAVDCAERVKHFMTDERSLNALVVARKHALGEESDEKLKDALYAAWRAAALGRPGAFRPAWRSAGAAAWAIEAAAAIDAPDIARATLNAAGDAAVAAACTDEFEWQVQRILELTDAGEWSPVGEKE